MLFLLRNIRRKLLSQDNKVISYLLYAVGEIILVVVGILIAVQIDDWNQERKKKQDGIEYRARLISDLQTDQNNLTKRIEFFDIIYEYGLEAESHLHQEVTSDFNDQWEFVYKVFQTSQIWPFRATVTTYNELQNNSVIQYVAKDSVLQQVSTYYIDNPEQLEHLTGGTTAYRDFVRGIIPISVQTHIWETCVNSSSIDQQSFTACDPPYELQSVIEEVYVNFRHSDDFNKVLTRRLATLQIRDIMLRNILNDNQKLQRNLNTQ